MLGIISGRLSSPIDNRIQAFPYHVRDDEFSIAKSFGFECIEWIFKEKNKEKNPILFKNGIENLLKLSKEFDVKFGKIKIRL